MGFWDDRLLNTMRSRKTYASLTHTLYAEFHRKTKASIRVSGEEGATKVVDRKHQKKKNVG